MSKKTFEEVEEQEKFLDVLVQESSHTSEDFIRELGNQILVLAKKNQRYSELECNRVLTKREQYLSGKVEENIRSIGERLHVSFSFDGDSRGFTVKLKTPRTGKFNTWGGKEDGWGIPTS